MRSVSRYPRRRGLTLIEVLVALFIMLIGVVSVLVLFPVGIRSVHQAILDTRGTILAQSAWAQADLLGLGTDPLHLDPSPAVAPGPAPPLGLNAPMNFLQIAAPALPQRQRLPATGNRDARRRRRQLLRLAGSGRRPTVRDRVANTAWWRRDDRSQRAGVDRSDVGA